MLNSGRLVRCYSLDPSAATIWQMTAERTSHASIQWWPLSELPFGQLRHLWEVSPGGAGIRVLVRRWNNSFNTPSRKWAANARAAAMGGAGDVSGMDLGPPAQVQRQQRAAAAVGCILDGFRAADALPFNRGCGRRDWPLLPEWERRDSICSNGSVSSGSGPDMSSCGRSGYGTSGTDQAGLELSLYRERRWLIGNV